MSLIDEYLLQALKANASDLHFVSGDPAREFVSDFRLRFDRHIEEWKDEVMLMMCMN